MVCDVFHPPPQHSSPLLIYLCSPKLPLSVSWLSTRMVVIKVSASTPVTKVSPSS